jgi:hypothetical protein
MRGRETLICAWGGGLRRVTGGLVTLLSLEVIT